jgi:hypothetical protein
MRRTIVFFFWLFASIPANTWALPYLSPKADISVLTCAPGNELYSIFGHSALRVKDMDLGIDKVYNYGTFDFNTPNFYLKFANGQLDYMLSAYAFRYFLPEYQRDQRWVKEQVLNLTQQEKQGLFEALEINHLPENKYYRYDFFFDNCATRIRDVVVTNLESDITYLEQQMEPGSFRDYLHEYLRKIPWTRDGIDLLLGFKADRQATAEERTFLPDYLMNYFQNLQIHRSSGSEPLVLRTNVLLDVPSPQASSTNRYPETITWLLFGALVLILFGEIKQRHNIFWIDRILLLITGLCGLLFTYLGYFTEHTVTDLNLNLLWALPTNILLAFVLRKMCTKHSLVYWIGLITWLLNGLLIVSWWALPQHIPAMVFPITGIQFLRLGKLLFSDLLPVPARH